MVKWVMGILVMMTLGDSIACHRPDSPEDEINANPTIVYVLDYPLPDPQSRESIDLLQQGSLQGIWVGDLHYSYWNFHFSTILDCMQRTQDPLAFDLIKSIIDRLHMLFVCSMNYARDTNARAVLNAYESAGFLGSTSDAFSATKSPFVGVFYKNIQFCDFLRYALLIRTDGEYAGMLELGRRQFYALFRSFNEMVTYQPPSKMNDPIPLDRLPIKKRITKALGGKC